MKLKIDENLPQDLVSELAAAGHDAESVLMERMTGASDSELLETARREGRVVLTLDKGIANVNRFPPLAFAGIVLFRPNSMGRGEVLKFVRRRLPAVPGMKLEARLVIVTDRGIRAR